MMRTGERMVGALECRTMMIIACMLNVTPKATFLSWGGCVGRGDRRRSSNREMRMLGTYHHIHCYLELEESSL